MSEYINNGFYNPITLILKAITTTPPICYLTFLGTKGFSVTSTYSLQSHSFIFTKSIIDPSSRDNPSGIWRKLACPNSCRGAFLHSLLRNSSFLGPAEMLDLLTALYLFSHSTHTLYKMWVLQLNTFWMWLAQYRLEHHCDCILIIYFDQCILRSFGYFFFLPAEWPATQC